jgi:hypothetical protein
MVNHQIWLNWCYNLGFFYKMDALIKIIKVFLLIKNLHSKGLEKRIRYMGVKKGHYFIF